MSVEIEFPLECLVARTPISLQAKRREAVVARVLSYNDFKGLAMAEPEGGSRRDVT